MKVAGFRSRNLTEKANVCLIGDTVKETYFPYDDPIGETLEIGGTEFRIIGLLQKREQLFGGGGGNNDQSNQIYMPMGAALKLKPNADDLFILAVAKEGKLEKAKTTCRIYCVSAATSNSARKTTLQWKPPRVLSNNSVQLRAAFL